MDLKISEGNLARQEARLLFSRTSNVSYNFIIFTIPIFEFLTIIYPVISAELGYSPVFEIKKYIEIKNKSLRFTWIASHYL